MTLHPPFIITSRLMPGVKIENATISIEFGNLTRDGRIRYHYFIDIEGQPEHEASDLKSGVGGGSLQGGMESLLVFLAVAAESYHYDGMDGENSDLFPEYVNQWADQNSDEISLIACELREAGELIED